MQAHRIPPRTLLVLFLLLFPSLASADGCFVWRARDTDILEPEQKALIIQDGGWEDLVLEVKYSGAARNFGWIIPVPANPTLRADKPHLFVTLSRATQRDEPAHAWDDATMGMDEVKIEHRERVGVYDTATLSAHDGAALAAWLRDNGYQVAEEAQSVFREYAAKGWLFVAVRIAVPDSETVEGKLREGTLQPLRLRFASAEPVFPLRVSAASGHPSEVLVYVVTRHPLYAADDPKAMWKSEYCRGASKWIWTELDPDNRFPVLRDSRPFLTKLRAQLQPKDMRDLRFAAIDPRNFLSKPDSNLADVRQRARGASMLGEMRDTASVPALIQFIRTPNRAEEEIRSGIWALGQIGTPEAIDEVARWALDPRPVLSRDAIVTLQAAGSRAAIDVCLDRVAKMPPEMPRDFADDRRDPSVQYLLHVLKPADLPLVNRKLPPSNGLVPGDYWSWPALRRGDWIRLVLGDPVTTGWVCDSLVSRGAESADEDANTRGAGGSINGFPMSYWTGAAVAFDFFPPGSEWRLFDGVMEKLQDFPSQREAILHRIAKDPRLPEPGRVIAISRLKAPSAQELAYLRGIWKSARAGNDSSLLVGMSQLGGPQGSVEYRVRACKVAYALGRLRAIDDLLRMWSEVRGEGIEDVLRGDVAYALALTDTALAVGPLVEYVRTTWAGKYTQPRLVDWGRRGGPPKADLLSDRGLDFEYRTRRIMGTIAQRGSSSQLSSLICDENLPPYFRLYWIPNAGLYRAERAELIPLIDQSIRQIEATAHGDSLLLGACDTARRMVQSSIKIRDGEFTDF